jgi:ribosomal protein S18 acetylase RimI-like enzyme
MQLSLLISLISNNIQGGNKLPRGYMNIRLINKEDVSDFIGCYQEVWRSLKGILPDVYVDDQIKQATSREFHSRMIDEASSPNSLLLAATKQGETVGLAWGNLREDDSTWLTFLGVKPGHRRRGVGTSLLARFIEESRSRGSGKVSLDTDPRLVPAVRLYEGMGFVAEGTVENKYGLQLVVYGLDIT